MKIIYGDIKPFNSYYLDDMKKNYRKQYVKEFVSIDYFIKWSKTVSKPLLNGKFLALVREKDYIRDVLKVINKLEEAEKRAKYIDVVWLAPNRVNLRNYMITCDVIDLRESLRKDFEYSVRKDLPELSAEGYDELIKRIGFSWDRYELYQDSLIQAHVTDPTDIRKIVKSEVIKSAPDTLCMIIERKRFCYNNYIKLVNKYSKRWVNQFFMEQLDKILDTKIKYASKLIGAQKILSSREMAKYWRIILNVPITDIFLLRHLLDDSLGLELYIRCTTKQLMRMEHQSYKDKKICEKPINYI